MNGLKNVGLITLFRSILKEWEGNKFVQIGFGTFQLGKSLNLSNLNLACKVLVYLIIAEVFYRCG